MAKAAVYVETSVVGSLVGRPSWDMLTATRQQITREWWPHARTALELFVSPVVLDELARGDVTAAAERLAAIDDIPMLASSAEAAHLVEALMAAGLLPAGSEADATHIAIAAANGMDFLVTWNFRHINNVYTKSRIEKLIVARGLACPVLCSPEEIGVP